MKVSFVRDRITWLCYAFLAFYSYFLNSMGPITPLIKGELGLSYTVAGLHYSAYALGLLVIGLLGESTIERLGKRLSLWIGAFGMSLGSIPLMLGTTPFVTIPASFIMGLVGSLILVIVPSTLSERHGEQRAVALTESNVIASAVSATPPLFLGLSVRAFGNWRPALAFAALVPFGMLAIIGKTRAEPGQGGEARIASLPIGKAPSLSRLFWVYWGGIFLAVCAEFGMISWASDFLAQNHGLDGADAASTLSVFLLAMIVGRIAGSALSRRIRVHVLLLAAVALGFAGFLAFWLGKTLPLALAGLFATGLGISSLYPFLLSLAIGSAGGQIVRASAIATTASGAAILCLPALLGRIADGLGIKSAYAVIPLVFAALAAIVIMTMARGRRSSG